MKVMLINPPSTDPDRYPTPYYPTGLTYIAGALKKNKYEITFLDALALGNKRLSIDNGFYNMGLSYGDILNEIKKQKPDVIGISVVFSINWKNCSYLCRLIKEKFPKIILILGGPHICAAPIECLKDANADYYIIGEGEEVLPELCHSIRTGKKQDQFIRADIIKNLDNLPFPARDLLQLDIYFRYAQNNVVHGINGLNRWVTLITSRGCPYGCIFCSIHNSMGKKYRARSAGNVISEIENLVETYKITDIIFEDDNLTFDKQRFKTICQELIRRNYNIKWYVPNGIRSEGLDEEMLLLMKKSGCQEIWLGVESGDQRVLNDIIHKKLKLENIKNVIKIASSIGLKVGCFFIIGFPGEKIVNFKKTNQLKNELYRLGMANHWTGYATPYFGTGLYNLCVERGYLIKNFDPLKVTPHRPSIISSDWSIQTLKWHYGLIRTTERNVLLRQFIYLFHILPIKLQDFILYIKYKFKILLFTNSRSSNSLMPITLTYKKKYK